MAKRMTPTYILGNWKMNGDAATAQSIAEQVDALSIPEFVKPVVFPPATLIHPLRSRLSQDSRIAIGGQDCSNEVKGAFTGETSAGQLKEAGCEYVILGHSERRAHRSEDNALVNAKAQVALAQGLTPVICVGESARERDSGAYLDVIRKQVTESVPRTDQPVIVAYEPCWSIGTGKVPTPEEITQVHKTIASTLASVTSRPHTPILYGGSVTDKNAADILAAEGVNGVLVGGASLDPHKFCDIIKAARQPQKDQARERNV